MRLTSNTKARGTILAVLSLIAASGSVAGAANVDVDNALTRFGSGVSADGGSCGQSARSNAAAARRLQRGYGVQIRGFVADKPYALVGRVDLDLTSAGDATATAKVTEVLAGTHEVSKLRGCWTVDATGKQGEISFPRAPGRCRRIIFFVVGEGTALLLQCVPATSPAVDGVAANGRALAIGDIAGSLQGTFSVQGEGFAANVPVALTGMVELTSDRRISGTVAGGLTEAQAGIRNDNSLSGTYWIGPDGIGEATLHAEHHPAEGGLTYEEDHHIRFVAVDSARTALVILLDSDMGVTLTAQVSRM